LTNEQPKKKTKKYNTWEGGEIKKKLSEFGFFSLKIFEIIYHMNIRNFVEYDETTPR
jgi:hypothetical protein